MTRSFSVEYFNERVLAEIEAWPVGVLADYLRLVELLIEFGPDLRMPHSRGHCTAISSVSGSSWLHAFMKKTQATPERDLKTARRRMREVRDG